LACDQGSLVGPHTQDYNSVSNGCDLFYPGYDPDRQTHSHTHRQHLTS